jgi:hypothetical protein
MIECSVCRTKNGDLRVVCSHCGGYLQARVQTLDLFETLWMLIESPHRAFKRICLSEQKNYIHFLAAVCGVDFVLCFLWYVRGGWLFEYNLQVLILALTLSGPIAGILLLYIGTGVHYLLARVMKSRPGFREVKAILAYAMVPLMFASVFLVPLELGLFGLSFFTRNPSPMVLKPGSYIVLLGMNGLTIVWTYILLVIGTRVLLAKGRVVSMVLSFCTLAVIGMVIFKVLW